MRKIIPTVFAKNKEEFNEKFRNLIGVSKEIQIDFMDGKFVNSKGVSLRVVPNLKRYDNKFEAHLMVRNPGKMISKLRKKGFYKVLFHYESLKDLGKIQKLIDRIKKNKIEAWIVFNPNTGSKKIIDTLDNIIGLKGIMLMGVNPGREGQKLNSEIFKKIKDIGKEKKRVKIQIDGGVNFGNISKLEKAGVSLFNSGSLVSKADDPKKVLKKLRG